MEDTFAKQLNAFVTVASARYQKSKLALEDLVFLVIYPQRKNPKALTGICGKEPPRNVCSILCYAPLIFMDISLNGAGTENMLEED